ncbi:cytidine deaminase [Pantoea sp. 1.19]|uniref:cytidine deaminase n=1 Tax=Pantoea sp. 1.19 TaxID=1925589 RepID=UPI000948E13E|nr:cytidine deaminase [Pantoea sp. 1.19]
MHSRYTTALATLPASLQQALYPWLDDPAFAGRLSADAVAAITQQSGLDEDALALALLPLAAACARASVSHFNVGAIARGERGDIYFGANMEFAGSTMQQTVHAEQSAISHAWMQGETRLRAITVNYTPCGHCRQFMNELNSGTALMIHLPGRQPDTLAAYLPAAFGPRDLAIDTLLLDPQDQQFTAQGDALTRAAIQAASLSHAPYSGAHSGVALESQSGRIYSGRYAENAAFNPSLPPLQVALNLLNLAGESCDQIQRAVLAERDGAALQQRSACQQTLRALGCDNLQRVTLPASGHQDRDQAARAFDF